MQRRLLVVAMIWLSFSTLKAEDTPRVAKVFVVVLENENADIAMQQPFHREIAKRGVLLTNYHGLVHPSQPNYIAMVAGSMHGVKDNGITDVDARHLGDLLEEKGLSWKVYAEGYPGKCFVGAAHGSKRRGQYVRRHVPFISFKNVNRNRARCEQHIVNASELDRDLARGTLPNFGLYIPDNQNNGHDSGVRAADAWLRSRFETFLADRRFMDDLLFVVTYDESRRTSRGNRVATLLFGSSVNEGSTSGVYYDHYNLLRTIEELLGLRTLGKRDASVTAIRDVWR